MRYHLLLIPAALLLPATIPASQSPAAPRVLLRALGVTVDTGDSAAGRRGHPAAAVRCPMPVERPEPDATVPIPTSREQPSGTTVVSAGEAPAGLSRMPVARADCWNPLDRPRGARDSIVIDSILPGH